MVTQQTPVIEFDLTKPEDARAFTDNLWVENRRVEGVQLPSGWLDFNAMTDEQICVYASELYTDWMVDGSKMKYRKPPLQ